jgi:hypothetical protein
MSEQENGNPIEILQKNLEIEYVHLVATQTLQDDMSLSLIKL